MRNVKSFALLPSAKLRRMGSMLPLKKSRKPCAAFAQVRATSGMTIPLLGIKGSIIGRPTLILPSGTTSSLVSAFAKSATHAEELQ